jgi:hypothetical protein
MEVLVDGRRFELTEKMLYKGILIEDLPNLAMIFGYVNASWTLKADLASEYVCRILKWMDARGLAQCTPRNHDPSMKHEPFVDLTSGYFRRAIGRLPMQGDRPPWRLNQDYLVDLRTLRFGRIDDGVLQFSRPPRQRASG